MSERVKAVVNERVKEVVGAIVDAVQRVLLDKQVTEAEYRAGVMYLQQVADHGEAVMIWDALLESTVIAAKARTTRGSTPAIQGPFFTEGAPTVDGVLKTYETDDHEPLIVKGTVRDENGKLLDDVTIDVWHSTPDGKYSGFHDGIPTDFYRGKVRVGADGRYRVRTTMPVPYQLPDGPTGALLEMMGSHSWRPAHVHFKVRKEGYEPLTTQYYFQGGDWVDDDCCQGVSPELVVPKVTEDGVRVMNVDFAIAHARTTA